MSKQVNTKKETIKVSSDSNIYDSYIKGKELYYLFGVILLACYIVFSDFISLKKVYLFRDIGSDSINFMFPWLIGASEYIKAEGIMGWSFAQGLGQNAFPLWLSDFFLFFLSLFDKTSIPFGLVFLEIVKIFLAGLIFYNFLKELKLSNFTCLIFAFLYAFSGFIILGGCWTVFSTEGVYASLILYGFERWLNHSKITWFVVGITCMAFLQPFFLFMYTILIASYTFVRYNDVKEKNNKQFLIFILKTIGLAILAISISSFQLFADLLQYIESPRVSGEASFFAKLQQQSIFAMSDDNLRFTTIFRLFGSDILGTGSNFKGWQNYLEAPNFYCGILCLVTFPQFFISLNKRQKYFYAGITLLFSLAIIFPYFRYAFWAFTGDYYRTFSLVIIFFLLMFSARALTVIENTGKLNKVVLVVTVFFLLFLLYTPANQFKPAVNTSLRSFVTFLIFIYAGLLFALSKKSNFKNVSKILLLLFCFFELVYFSNITVNKRDVVTKSQIKEKVGYNDYTLDAVTYLKKRDKSFYRINKDYTSGLAIHSSLNDSKVQGYYSTQVYYSFNQKNYIKFLGDLNVINPKDENSTRWVNGLGGRPILFSLTSGKYWLSKRTDNAIINMGFDSIYSVGDVKVYRNKYALPFGFIYSKIISENEFKKLSPQQKDFCILRSCVIATDDSCNFATLSKFNLNDTVAPQDFNNYQSFVNELKKDSFLITKFSENHIVGQVNTKKSNILFFSIPFDEGWNATINGSEAKLMRLNCGLTGLLTKDGNNAVELTFVARYMNIGSIISIIALLFFVGLSGSLFYRNRFK